MTPSDVQVTVDGRAVIAHVTGEIDMSNADDVGEVVVRATPNRALGVVLDLTEVNYLDSAGIYMMFGLRECLVARGQALWVVIPDASPVNDTLKLAGVNRSIDVVQSLVEGLLAIQLHEGHEG
jgi:anti-anti-sigma factor